MALGSTDVFVNVAGGVRIDHIIGLFRLWWIPKGALPTEGTYVRYDHEAMILTAQLLDAAIDVRADAHDRYIRKVDAEHEQLIWTHPGMTTYYRNDQGRVFSAMPWRFVDYWAMTHDPDMRDYRLTNA